MFVSLSENIYSADDKSKWTLDLISGPTSFSQQGPSVDAD